MNKGLSFLICFFAIHFSFAQQDKQFTHYMFDKMSYNPATTGFSGYIAQHLFTETNGIRVERAPNTTLLNHARKFSTTKFRARNFIDQ
jgi:hypothetical protein